MDPFGAKALATATIVASLLAYRAVKKQTLTTNGAVAGFVVGFLLVATGLRGMVLVYFYQLGSMATKYKKSTKAAVDATVLDSSVRGASQVLAVSLLATILSVLHAYWHGNEKPIDFIMYPHASRLTSAVLAHHAVCLGDTLSSELGMLSTLSSSPTTTTDRIRRPILITQPWRTVPTGTNGGVSLQGTLWSFVGGAVIGFLTAAMDVVSGIPPVNTGRMIAYGAICGLSGSILDSILGATVQASYWDPDTRRVYPHSKSVPRTVEHICGKPWLSNEQVNVASVAIVTFIGGWIIAPWLFTL
jgi:uncharacterized protein (TIGR00297 family)